MRILEIVSQALVATMEMFQGSFEEDLKLSHTKK